MDESDEKADVDDDDELDDDDVGLGVVVDDDDDDNDDDADIVDAVDDGSLSVSVFRRPLFDNDFDRRKDLRLKSRNELNNINDDGKKLNDRFVLSLL